ncbi:MAG: radical SAM domain-containing protein, partial [Deltaproteobacteria bacterium]|nr:radical SAM domain-containing protein [Deltaproteobacteria bacterium]
GRDFSLRTEQNILEQIEGLKAFYGPDLSNYNSLFLGQHDALHAGREILEFAALKAYEVFEFTRSDLRGPRLFLFGSVESLMSSPEELFESLNGLPFSTYINIGLESADPATLAILKKPVAPARVAGAFGRMVEINRRYEKLEITANFILGGDLPESHLSSLLVLARDGLDRFYDKGAIYLSPLMDGKPITAGARRRMLKSFHAVKISSRLPVFIYLIQRL